MIDPCFHLSERVFLKCKFLTAHSGSNKEINHISLLSKSQIKGNYKSTPFGDIEINKTFLPGHTKQLKYAEKQNIFAPIKYCLSHNLYYFSSNLPLEGYSN